MAEEDQNRRFLIVDDSTGRWPLALDSWSHCATLFGYSNAPTAFPPWRRWTRFIWMSERSRDVRGVMKDYGAEFDMKREERRSDRGAQK